MIEILGYILAGGAIGFIVGLTGVGGGSFMTPILLSFGFAPTIAVGTDLLYAAITKSGGVITHARQSTVDWKIVATLALGSIPASLASLYLLHHLKMQSQVYEHILTTTLGVMLVVTSIVLLLRRFLLKERSAIANSASRVGRFEQRYSVIITVIMGFILGTVVTLSSVGAGAFGAAALLMLYPRLPMLKVIGTDIAHAVPLTLIAGLGHLQLGHVNLSLLLCLISGSLPAIWLGTKLASRLPEHYLRPLMAIALMLLGLKYLF